MRRKFLDYLLDIFFGLVVVLIMVHSFYVNLRNDALIQENAKLLHQFYASEYRCATGEELTVAGGEIHTKKYDERGTTVRTRRPKKSRPEVEESNRQARKLRSR